MSAPVTASPRVERSKAAILDATLALLAEEGVGGLTVDAVAARARVGKATVYRHWSSRADLIVDAVSSLLTDDEIVDCGNLRDDLRIAYDRIGNVCSNGALAQVLPTLAEAAARDPELATVHRDFVARRRKHLIATMERAAARGELRPGVDPAIAADLVAGPMFYKKLVHHQCPDQEYATALLDLVMAALSPTP
jgi:AcrR family transcriptional regulator